MSDATTGVPAAIASRRTTPKLSPWRDGAQNTAAVRSLWASSSSEIRPSHSTPGGAEAARAVVFGPSPANQRTASRSRRAKALYNNSRSLWGARAADEAEDRPVLARGSRPRPWGGVGERADHTPLGKA